MKKLNYSFAILLIGCVMKSYGKGDVPLTSIHHSFTYYGEVDSRIPMSEVVNFYYDEQGRISKTEQELLNMKLIETYSYYGDKIECQTEYKDGAFEVFNDTYTLVNGCITSIIRSTSEAYSSISIEYDGNKHINKVVEDETEDDGDSYIWTDLYTWEDGNTTQMDSYLTKDRTGEVINELQVIQENTFGTQTVNNRLIATLFGGSFGAGDWGTHAMLFGVALPLLFYLGTPSVNLLSECKITDTYFNASDYLTYEYITDTSGMITTIYVSYNGELNDTYTLTWDTSAEADIIVDGITYEVNEDGTATIASAKHTANGNYVIPSSVVIDGVEYTVTEIGANAFNGCTDLTSVTIPASITYVGEHAFAGCVNLMEVIVKGKKPAGMKNASARLLGRSTVRMDVSQFEGIDFDNCILYVPFGYESLYSEAEGWKEFRHIVGVHSEEDPIITVTANSYTREYGEENPVFEFTTEGAELDGNPSVTCEATTQSTVGTYDIVISKGNVNNYNDKYVNGTLTITKAPLVIKVGNYTRKQGEENPEFTLEYEGFKNDETANVLSQQPVVHSEAFEESEPGKYEIKVYGAEADNYEITFVNGELTVTEADPVTVTAKSYTREYGEDNPAFEYSTDGAMLSGEPEIECEATAASSVGTYPIVITKGGVTNYNDSYVNGTLTITKAPLTIGCGEYTMKQGEQLPDFIVTYLGFKNDDTEDVLSDKPLVTTTATSESAPGTYEIAISGADAQNYEISYIHGLLTITEADPVIITANSYTRVYGDANPTFEFTSAGATLNGLPEISCEATEITPVGAYPIVITKGGVTNYNDSYVNGTLTITKAPLIISCGEYIIKQGEQLPDFIVTYLGFKNDDTEDVLSDKPLVTTTATSESAPGTYEITISGADAQNYEISYIHGLLTITEADPVIVTANNYTRVYGDANPTFEFTSTGATLNGLPEISCEATEITPVGTYPIVITKGGVTNYNDSYVNGILTITKAPLKVTVANATREQGEENPEFVIRYEGWKNNDTETVLTKKPLATTVATKESDIGEYAIVVSGGEALNYELNYVNGILTVTVPSGILEVQNCGTFDVYTTAGRIVKKGATTLKGLAKGVYIVNGRKIIVK